MERGSKRPDGPKLALATVRAAVIAASRLLPGLTMVAGGKSFGGRMTSQAQAETPLPGVRGFVFLGFPLHPPGRPSDARAEHLFKAKIPMLFLQGSRDAGGRPPYTATRRAAWSGGDIEAVSRCRPFVSCASTHRPKRHRNQIRNVKCNRRLDRKGGRAGNMMSAFGG
jgi:hypothetical protein